MKKGALSSKTQSFLIILGSFSLTILVLLSFHVKLNNDSTTLTSPAVRQTWVNITSDAKVNNVSSTRTETKISNLESTKPILRSSYQGLKVQSISSIPPIITTSVNMPRHSGVPWSDFAKYSFNEIARNRSKEADLISRLKNFEYLSCPATVLNDLRKPQLTAKDFSWCQWALSENGANVVVGKSWGKLDKKEMLKFDALNCNTVKAGKNPSCDDSWGDAALKKWIQTPLANIGCEYGKTSKVHCFKNDNSDSFCMMENVQIDFSKWRTTKRPGNTDSKNFQQNFLSTDCSSKTKEPAFPFPHLYSPRLASSQCDYVHNGTVLLYSHDDIRNLGHTLNDIMNVWVMLWLSNMAMQSDRLNILNIDSFKLGHNWQDAPNAFFNIYRRSFNSILKGVDFADKTLCIQKVLVQPIPPRFFIWESWFIDLPCSFLGPSSLYQRYNLHVRHSYGLLPEKKGSSVSDNVFSVLLVVRKIFQNLWGSNRSSRNYMNLPEVTSSIEAVLNATQAQMDIQKRKIKFQLLALDLNDIDFDQQMKLLGETSIIIGMHGAGQPSSKYVHLILDLFEYSI